ncbi:MAG: alpha/beta fold hydrolase [Proteobacteria bacterium]|nr:alpha/beta fold hydrolase [Pseudomonadota bacterium]
MTTTLATLELGDPAHPPLVYLHGFPDAPSTARDFLARLAVDRRVIAPWLRGYAPSPLGGPYDLATLADDVIALIDRIGAPVELVGHDWGAAITYAVCARAPTRVRRAVTLALPHPRTFLARLRVPAQLRRSWYMAMFNVPGAGFVAMGMIDRLWRTWSPGFTLDAERRSELHATLRASMPAPLGYYRAAWRVPRLPRITTPLLQLHGADDGCVLPPGEADGRRFAERVYEVVPGVGHFLHLEAPAAIAARVRAWFRA